MNVLDAALFVAVVSPSEVHHHAARRLYATQAQELPFLVPSLFRVEVLAALARRNEPVELLDTVDALVSGPRFHSVSVDAALLERAVEVARSTRLRAYDAVYVALALMRGAALLTLDVDLRQRTVQLYPELTFVDSTS